MNQKTCCSSSIAKTGIDRLHLPIVTLGAQSGVCAHLLSFIHSFSGYLVPVVWLFDVRVANFFFFSILNVWSRRDPCIHLLLSDYGHSQ